MFAFFFNIWATTLGIAAAAVSVPIIIHLLNRRRYKIVIWAAMRFLLNAQKQTTRKMRLEQLILLCVRCLLLLLLVAAMASVMPWAEDMWASLFGSSTKTSKRSTRTHHILVLDGTLSMNQDHGGKALAFQQAIDQAVQTVEGAQAGDGFSVLVLKDNPTWIVGNASQFGVKVSDEIRRLKASHGNGSLESCLAQVRDKVREHGSRFPTQVVYFYTDVQRATWQAAQSDKATTDVFAEIQKEAQFALIDVGKDKTENVAVTDLFLRDPLVTTGSKVEVMFAIQNFGSEERKVKVQLLRGRARETSDQSPLSLGAVDNKELTVKGGERVEASFEEQKFDRAGAYAIQIKIEAADDRLAPDNTRTMILTVKDEIPILLVNGKDATPDRLLPPNPFHDKATEFLRYALNPAVGEEEGWAKLAPKVVTQDEFSRLTDVDLAKYDCIFLCDITPPHSTEVARLENHLRRGGGLVISMGGTSARNLEGLNRALFKEKEGLLPARLERHIAASEDHYFMFDASPEAFRKPPLKEFAGDRDRLSLASRPFMQFVQADPVNEYDVIMTFGVQQVAGSEKPLDVKLPNGRPALMAWNPLMPARKAGEGERRTKGRNTPYRGKVILFTSTLNKDWNEWPGSPSYAAMMQELLRLGVSGKLWGQANLVSEALEEYFPSPGKATEITVRYPEELEDKDATLTPRKLRVPPLDDVLPFRWAETDYGGVYRVVLDGAPREHPFAINVPTVTSDAKRGSECDLGRLKDADLKALYPKFEFQLVTRADAVSIKLNDRAGPLIEEREPRGPGIARWLLIIALVLIFVEIILAWRFGHYTSVEGTTQPASIGLMWPLIIVTTAGVLFLAGAYVLLHAHFTGDFLGFLPDRFRNWVETKVLNLEAPPAGETSRWVLIDVPWLPSFLERNWFPMFIVVGSLVFLILIYRLEAPSVSMWFKGLLAVLRMGLILLMVYVLCPQKSATIDRQGMPDIVLIIDTSLSMGVPDNFVDVKTKEKAKQLAESIKTRLKERLPARLKELTAQIENLKAKDAVANKVAIEDLTKRLEDMDKQAKLLDAPNWRPSRLSLAQAVILSPENDWLRALLQKSKSKVHIYDLDVTGKARKLADAEDAESIAGDLLDPNDEKGLDRARKAIAALEPTGKDSQLGLSLREVINQYRGSSLTAVVMVTDGVTTREETIEEVSDHAKLAGVPLFFLGIGDDHDIQDLEIYDLKVDDTIYLGDRAVFKANIKGRGFKDLKVPIVLKLKEKDGKEKEVAREKEVKIDPEGRARPFSLVHQPTEPGKKHYIIEVELKREKGDKGPSASKLRLERTIEVIETKQIRVLYIEGQPRYEYRYLKALLERENPDLKKNKSIELKVLLLDSDPDFHTTDKTALKDFPATREALEDNYDVIFIGDCDPRHKLLGEERLRMLADFVKGDDGGKSKRKTPRAGGGLLFIAGAFHNPHSYKGTPLGELLPVDTFIKPPEPEVRSEKLKLELTAMGRLHNIFRLGPDDADTMAIWKRIQPMFWHAAGYRVRPLAEVLAVHPTVRGDGGDGKLPLVVQQYVGTGRVLFFGFEESWRWRHREDEVQYNRFWVQTVRYLARARQSRTELRLDKQTPYRDGETIKISVTFPENMPGGVVGLDTKEPRPEVKVIAEVRPTTLEEDGPPPKPEIQPIVLAKVEGSTGTYEASVPKARAGKYRFWLSTPDVTKFQPDGEKPSAEAVVELPPRETEDLRLNYRELSESATKTEGGFYTLGTVETLLDDIPPGQRPSLASPLPPQKLWNHWLCFTLALLLFTAEWILRKKKHLL